MGISHSRHLSTGRDCRNYRGPLTAHEGQTRRQDHTGHTQIGEPIADQAVDRSDAVHGDGRHHDAAGVSEVILPCQHPPLIINNRGEAHVRRAHQQKPFSTA
jgi:hypothetical protein